jgi:hypothetical protein
MPEISTDRGRPSMVVRGWSMPGVAIAGSTAFLTLLSLLHALRPDLDPSWRFISEYEIGAYGWLMQFAFLCLGTGTAATALALLPLADGVLGRLGITLLGISAAGMFLAALFIPDARSRLHDIGAMLDQIPFAALLIQWRLSRRVPEVAGRAISWIFAALPLVAFVLFVAAMAVQLPRHGGRPGPEVLVGWPNRLMILTQCMWLIHVGWRLLRGRQASAMMMVGELTATR